MTGGVCRGGGWGNLMYAIKRRKSTTSTAISLKNIYYYTLRKLLGDGRQLLALLNLGRDANVRQCHELVDGRIGVLHLELVQKL